MRLRFNGDTGSSYRSHSLVGTGSSVVSQTESQTSIYLYTAAASGDTANVFSANVMDILDAFSTNKNTTIRQLATNGVGIYDEVSLASGAWFNTAAVTSVQVLANTSNFVSGTRISIYGIRGS
jgi:hypothetical protein